jgi:AraC-like DNA-binding protein
MSLDTLSEVLRAVRLKGAIFFSIDGTAPWLAATPPAREIGPYLMPGAGHVMEYHMVTAGTAYGATDDEPPVRLEAGDVIVFPQGDSHVISSGPGMRGTVDYEPFKAAQGCPLPIGLRLDGGGAERSRVTCGFLGLDARPFNPLLSALPRVIHVPGLGAEGTGFASLVRMAVAESGERRPGSEAMLARVSELLFVEVVRRYTDTLPPENRTWLAGLRDESVGRVLGKLHERAAHDWTLDELARQSGLSRSVLAERFTQFVGLPPMQYLAQWRMQLAATMLSTSSAGLAEISAQVGYGSEAAFSKAFKRTVGVSPAEWRRRRA